MFVTTLNNQRIQISLQFYSLFLKQKDLKLGYQASYNSSSQIKYIFSHEPHQDSSQTSALHSRGTFCLHTKHERGYLEIFPKNTLRKHPQRDAAPLTFRSAAWLSTSSAPLANVLFDRWTDLWKFTSFLSLTESPNKSMVDQDVSVTTQASRERRSWRAEGVL